MQSLFDQVPFQKLTFDFVKPNLVNAGNSQQFREEFIEKVLEDLRHSKTAISLANVTQNPWSEIKIDHAIAGVIGNHLTQERSPEIYNAAVQVLLAAKYQGNDRANLALGSPSGFSPGVTEALTIADKLPLLHAFPNNPLMNGITFAVNRDRRLLTTQILLWNGNAVQMDTPMADKEVGNILIGVGSNAIVLYVAHGSEKNGILRLPMSTLFKIDIGDGVSPGLVKATEFSYQYSYQINPEQNKVHFRTQFFRESSLLSGVQSFSLTSPSDRLQLRPVAKNNSGPSRYIKSAPYGRVALFSPKGDQITL